MSQKQLFRYRKRINIVGDVKDVRTCTPRIAKKTQKEIGIHHVDIKERKLTCGLQLHTQRSFTNNIGCTPEFQLM